jgi:hypothetical protein
MRPKLLRLFTLIQTQLHLNHTEGPLAGRKAHAVETLPKRLCYGFHIRGEANMSSFSTNEQVNSCPLRPHDLSWQMLARRIPSARKLVQQQSSGAQVSHKLEKTWIDKSIYRDHASKTA